MQSWESLTLFLYITMRMSGFILFSPVFSRRGIPGLVRAGFILLLSLLLFSITEDSVPVPPNLIDFGIRLIFELFIGFTVGLIMHIFFYIAQLAGESIDTQMAFTMGKIYDAGTQASLSVTSTLLNILMFLLFFSTNGHHTLLRIFLTSDDAIAFGSATISPMLSSAIIEIFISCTLLAVKLALPILAAEIIGQVGMGILMKAIPQINVFSINIELKVIIGLSMLFLLITPISHYLLDAETEMLASIRSILYSP